jgi:cytosine/adenosine deaminase-related metal-dependent hydrolase
LLQRVDLTLSGDVVVTLDAAFVRVGELLGCWEMMRGGTITFLDMYFQPDAAANAVLAAGMPGVSVIHNPISNLKLASGIAPVPAMMSAGVRLGLGTDRAASHNTFDIWQDMKAAALLPKGTSLDPTVVPAPAVMRMATLGGAEALGLGDQVGAIGSGRRADLIQIRLDAPHMIPATTSSPIWSIPRRRKTSTLSSATGRFVCTNAGCSPSTRPLCDPRWRT